MSNGIFRTRRQRDIGRRALAGMLVAVWTAAPDLTPGRWSRRALRAGVVVGGVTASAVLDLPLKPRPGSADADAPVDSDRWTMPAEPVARAGVVAIGAVTAAVAVGAWRAGEIVERRIVRALDARGVERPYVWLGVVYGLVQAALPESDA